jgi:hypothetical protein
MRTPWRFVADLVSRKPKTHGHDENSAVAPKTIALEYKPVPEEEQPGLDATPVDRSAEPDSETQVEARRLQSDTDPTEARTAASVEDAPAVAVGDGEPANLATTEQAEETSPVYPGTEAAKATTKASAPRRKRVASITKSLDSIGTALDEAPAIAAGPRSFTDEMADLDAEVDALRRQLARKLLEQNAQLRKMLARFDVR